MDEDIRLIESYLAGSEDAIDGLVMKYQRQIYTFVYRMINDMEEAKDLTQKTFINAINSLRGFRQESSFKTWLFQIAKNLSLNHIKQNRHEDVEVDESLTGEQSGALSAVIENEIKGHIRRGLEGLPERQRLAVILRVYEGMSCSETASIMGCSEGAVKAHYHNGVKRLREILKEKGYEIKS